MDNLIFKDIILFSDIDGTLCTYDKKIPEKNLAAIERFKALGGRFSVCTGRSALSLRRAVDVSIFNFPAIIFNGGGIYDYSKDEYIKDSGLDMDVTPFVNEVIEKYPDVGLEVNVENVLYCVKYSERSGRHILTENDEFRLYDMSELPKGQYKKVLFTGSREDIDRLSSEFLSRNSDGNKYYFLRSEPTLFELLPINAKKGEAVKEISKMFNVPIENICAIGDYYNDVTMLEAAGCSCAVSGAPDEIKDIADYISCSCEDGAVADFISYIESVQINKR